MADGRGAEKPGEGEGGSGGLVGWVSASWLRTSIALFLAGFLTTLALFFLTGTVAHLERLQTLSISYGGGAHGGWGRRSGSRVAHAVDYAYLPIDQRPNTTGEVRQTDDGRTLAHLPRADCDEVHGSSLLGLQDGSLLLAYYCGDERNGTKSEVSIVVSKLRAGARVWDYPFVVSSEPGRTARNPVLWYDRDEKRVVLWHTSQLSGLGEGTAEVRMLVSPDGGDNFTYPETIFDKGFGLLVHHRPLLSKRHDGELLVPVYFAPGGVQTVKGQYSSLKWSRDNGRSWSPLGAEMTSVGSGIVQPCIVRPLDQKTRRPGDVLVAFFSDWHGSNIYRSRSLDEGRTWSEPERTPLPNPNTPIAATVLASGNIAMVFNNRRAKPGHNPFPTGRRLLKKKQKMVEPEMTRVVAIGDGHHWPLTVAISEDGGGSWPYVRDLEASWNASMDYSHPSIVQTADGRIHITYTWSGVDPMFPRSEPQSRLCIRHVALPGEEWVRLGAWTYSHNKKFAAQNRDVNMQVRHHGTLGLATQGEYRGRSVGSNKKLDEKRTAEKQKKRLMCDDRIGQFANSCDEDVGEEAMAAAAEAAASVLTPPSPSYDDQLNRAPAKPYQPDFKTGILVGG
ncbi:sialidase [Pycnococcus provasolii]